MQEFGREQVLPRVPTTVGKPLVSRCFPGLSFLPGMGPDLTGCAVRERERGLSVSTYRVTYRAEVGRDGEDVGAESIAVEGNHDALVLRSTVTVIGIPRRSSSADYRFHLLVPGG